MYVRGTFSELIEGEGELNYKIYFMTILLLSKGSQKRVAYKAMEQILKDGL